MPESMFIRVVLPLPFSPSRERISPRCSSRDTLSLATTSPKVLVSSFSWMAQVFSMPDHLFQYESPLWGLSRPFPRPPHAAYREKGGAAEPQPRPGVFVLPGDYSTMVTPSMT